MSYSENMSNSNLAFGSGDYSKALMFAEAAIKEEPKETEAYYAAGKACMSMDQPDKAVEYFTTAVEIDKKNGNGYFLLGYASAMAGKTAEALRALTRALENNCDETLKGQIYKIMTMINTDHGDFENALLNIEQAEQYIGIDYELLQQKAGCYASMRNYRDTLFTLNQMKLLQPNNYAAYSLAFHIFMDLQMYEEALAELKRAEDFADLTMTYYEDRIAFALMHDMNKIASEEMDDRWHDVLNKIDDALKKGQPNAEQVFEMYLRAAEAYTSIKEYDKALQCLDSSIDPVSSYNSGFSVIFENKTSVVDSSGDLLSPEEEEERLEEMWENGEFDDISEKMEQAMEEIDSDDPEEIAEAMQRYLTPLDSVPEPEKTSLTEYKISDSFEATQLQNDMRNAMYLPIYEEKEDYDNMLHKARALQSSNIVSNQYTGIYYELKIGKLKNDENWEKKYRDRINFWMKKMLEDPTDYLSAAYRIRCYIDLGDYEKAEQLCSCMPNDMQDTLMQELRKAKGNGGGDNVDTSG